MLCTRYNVTHQIMYGTNKDGSDDHVWVEANLNGKWVPLNYTGNYKYVRTESLLMLIKQVKNDYRRSR
jgi:transglutaminase-like putative cysteine protease